MNPTPIKKLSSLGQDAHLMLLQTSVPDVISEQFWACYPRSNHSGGLFLAEAIALRLGVVEENILAFGELNRFSLLAMVENGTSDESMKAIRGLLQKSFKLDTFAVISRFCKDEAFFRILHRGEMAGEIKNVTDFTKLRESLATAQKEQAKMVTETSLTMIKILQLLKNAPPQP